MVLSNREKSIAIGLGVVVALVLLYQFVYSPLFSWQDDLEAAATDVQAQKDADAKLSKKHADLKKVWADIMAGGLKSDASDAESQLQQGLTDWARESGITLTAQRVEGRPPEKNGFIQIPYQASGTGNSAQVSKLLWQIENTRIPVRIKQMQISSKKDGVDDLQIQLSLSTLCIAPPKPANQTRVVSATPPAGAQQ
ncbi:MAG TPA: hypothetical protein VN541_20215 [Tepidisphaeraceae bacterium]|nr:hypothetical protein [Tepidisphaeraceae bacterium]